jgi:exodeoxyribonuclease X
MQYECLIVDTETTGLTSSDKLFEYAHLALPTLEELQTSRPIYAHPAIEPHRSIWNPRMDIHPRATEVHGYTKESLAVYPHVEDFLMESTKYMIGHNVDFDARFLGEPDTKKICTIRLAKMVWPKGGVVTSYSLTNLIKALVEDGEELIKEAHGALPDCYLTIILLDKILEKLPRVTSWEELYVLQLPKSAKVPTSKGKTAMTCMPFGKHKGELFCDIPRSYLEWLTKQELTPALLAAVEGAMGLR